MNLKDMATDALLERRSAIATELDAEGADLDALEAEVRGINAELEARNAAEAQRNEIRSAVAQGAGKVVKTMEQQPVVQTRTAEEVRQSKEYIDAFARYIKSGDAAECRSLLSTNASGYVPVPTIIEGRIRTAWERLGLMDLVRKTYIPGNIKVGFELSADGAVIHTEGSAAPSEEVLTFGLVTLTPQSIKKWIDLEAA